MSFRKNLEYLRKNKNLSQEELANKLGVSRQAVSKWESGGAYPETEKLITMSKLFDCTFDELIKDDLEEARKEKNSKYTINDLINEITTIIRKSIDMITSMTFFSFIKFCFEMLILFVIILLLKIPFTNLINLGNDFFYNFGSQIGNIFSGLWRFIIEPIYFVIATITFVFIYKIRFLDKFDLIKSNELNNRKNEPQEVTKNETVVKKVEVVKYDFGIFSALGKIALFCAKCFSILIASPIILFLLFSVAGIIIAIYGLFQGITFYGLIAIMIASSIFMITLLLIIFNFITNRKTKSKFIFYLIITSIITLGIGSGLSVLEFKNMTITTNPPEAVEMDEYTYIYEMSENLIVNPYYNTSYIIDETLTDSIKIEISHYKLFTKNYKLDNYFSGDYKIIQLSPESVNTIKMKDLYNIILNDLSKKTLSDYSTLLNSVNIVVYSNQKNIDKLNANWLCYTEDCEETPLNDTSSTEGQNINDIESLEEY